MRQRALLIFLLFLTAIPAVFAQTGRLRGTLLTVQNEPVSDVQVIIPAKKLLTTTNGEGVFEFDEVPYGSEDVIISSYNIKPDTISVTVNGAVTDLGKIPVSYNEAGVSQQSMEIPVMSLEDNGADAGEEAVAARNVSGLLAAYNDPFLKASSFTWGSYWFSPRGYENNEQEIQINGIPMNDLETGDATWGQWGGLNDVIHWPASTYGLQPSEFAYGGNNGTVGFDATAASQRKQTRVSYSLSNRQYTNRLMLTHSSGLMDNGWAYSVSLSKRWGKEGYVPGTFYDGYSYYAGVSKRINDKHELDLTAFASSTRRGKAAFSYQEAYDLAGSHFYNSNWGYQAGEKRNARVADAFQPAFILNYKFTPSETLHWNTSVGYQFGKNATSGIDWYNAADPRPDYYKYLPGYYLTTIPPDTAAYEATKTAFRDNPQLDWDALYQANYLNRRAMPNVDGSLSNDTARRSVYILGNDVDDIKKWMLNTNLQKVLNDHITLYTGISFIYQQTESYKELLDLLGGDYFVDVNSFAERNFLGNNMVNQNDLNHPNRIVKVGDKYSYDYMMRFTKAQWWGQATFTYNKADLFISGRYGLNSFQREGLVRNGIFADGNQSFGKGEKQDFYIYGLKGGITYKVNGRNYLFINAGIAADAPDVNNVYYAARVRNSIVADPTTQKSYTAEGGYLLRSPRLSARVVGYVTDIKDQVMVQRFFYQGSGSSNSFVDVVMEHVNTRSTGLELGVEYKISSAFTVDGAAAIGESFFTDRVTGVYHNENFDDSNPYSETFYIKDYYQGVGPQSIYTAGTIYRSKKYWSASIHANYIDRNYIDIAGPRRTEQTVGLMQPESAAWNGLLAQEKLPSEVTVDVFGGKSFMLNKINKKIPRNVLLTINIGINNILDNKNVVNGGFENPRFDYANQSSSSFAPKYLYGFGRNFFINAALKF